MLFGLDYVSGPPIADLKAAGVAFVCRYLSEVNNLTQIKLLTPAEAKALGAAGIAIVSNFEWYANRASEGAVSGSDDAKIARDQHAACGGPSDRPIYFSVDFSTGVTPAIIDYFKGIASVIGLSRTGAYGSYAVIKGLFDAGVITWGWQTYAWSAGQWDPRRHIEQYNNDVKLAGASVDYNHSVKDDFGQWFPQRGGAPVPVTTTQGGENATFIDNITQLEPGETEDACVAFSCANVFYSTQPGTPNHHTPEDVDQLADKWYTRETGSITNSNGIDVPQLHTILDGMGLHWEPIPITNNGPANDEAVRTALRAGKLVIVCAAESSFFDLEIGRPPYSWNTQPFNHCIVATGNITSGPYKNNVWVRDTVAVSGGYPPSTKRPYDIGKMQYVSLTAVTPSWLKGETLMPIPTGWKEQTVNGVVRLVCPNGHYAVTGFRALIENDPNWDAADQLLEEEVPVSQVLLHNLTLGPGARQCTRNRLLVYTVTKGAFVEQYPGLELKAAYDQILALQAQVALLKANQPTNGTTVDTTQVEADVNAIIDAMPPLFAKLLGDVQKLKKP